jgi:hypothetical protein
MLITFGSHVRILKSFIRRIYHSDEFRIWFIFLQQFFVCCFYLRFLATIKSTKTDGTHLAFFKFASKGDRLAITQAAFSTNTSASTASAAHSAWKTGDELWIFEGVEFLTLDETVKEGFFIV